MARVGQDGAVRIDELAADLEVSAMTIHRDLDALAHRGLIERVRGGARAIGTQMTERDVAVRRLTNVALKADLAEVVLGLVHPGEVVALDDSTTVAAVGYRLARRDPGAVITHSLELIVELGRSHPDLTLIGLGGRYVPATDSFLGQSTCAQMRTLSADVSVVSTTSVRGGALYHPDEDAALTKRSCVALGQRKVLVFDSSKFDALGVHRVAALADFDDIVVDSQLSPAAAKMLQASGARIHLVAAQAPPEPTVAGPIVL